MNRDYDKIFGPDYIKNKMSNSDMDIVKRFIESSYGMSEDEIETLYQKNKDMVCEYSYYKTGGYDMDKNKADEEINNTENIEGEEGDNNNTDVELNDYYDENIKEKELNDAHEDVKEKELNDAHEDVKEKELNDTYNKDVKEKELNDTHEDDKEKELIDTNNKDIECEMIDYNYDTENMPDKDMNDNYDTENMPDNDTNDNYEMKNFAKGRSSKAINRRRAYLWLNGLSGLQLKRITEALNYFETPEEIFYASKEELLKVLPLRQTDMLILSRDIRNIEEYEKKLEKSNIKYITPVDEEYPERLKMIFDPPCVLYYKGDISILKEEQTLGVVGARAMSFYGKEMTSYFVSKLSKEGIVIVSGLAAGVDVEAHKAALKTDGARTIGVLGCGINICYPKENYLIYEEMCKNHLVISENPPDTEPLHYLFPLRNRIISGLSKGVLVVEARKKSGSLITADSCLEQGRNVYAIPGKITDLLSEGTNNLIKQGAIPVTHPNDIISDFKRIDEDEGDIIKATEPDNNLTDTEKTLLKVIGFDPMYIDDIITRARLSVSAGISAILNLANHNLIKEVYKGYYIRNIQRQ